MNDLATGQTAGEERARPGDPGRWAEWLRSRGPDILRAAVLAALLFALFKATADTLLAPERSAALPRASAGDPAKPELRVHAHLDRAPVHFEETARLWLVLDNRNGGPIGDLDVEVAAPGFRAASRPPAGSTPLRPRPGDVLVAAKPLPVPPAGRSRVLHADLVGTRRSGTSSVVVTVRWTEGQGRPEQTLSLADIPAISLPWLFAGNFLEALVALALPLALPAALALAGFFFQQHQQHLVHERQAWASMLPTSHENNVKYYLPVLESITVFKQELGRLLTAPAVDRADLLDRAFFRLLMVLRVFREVPGYYLMDRQGEQLVFDASKLFTGRLLRRFGRWLADVSALLDTFSLEENLATYRAKFASRKWSGLESKRDDLRREFDTWASRQAVDFQLLFLYRDLLRFEVNRIYRFWYGSDPDFPVKDAGEAIEELAPQAEDSTNPDREALRAFLKELLAYWAKVSPATLPAKARGRTASD